RIRYSPAHPRDRHDDRSCHRAAAPSPYRRGAQAMSETLREVALRDLRGLRARHREVFAGDWRQRAALLAGIILPLALAAYGLWRLDFSLNRLGSGLGQIAHMVSLMFPPSPGGRLPLYLQALTETLAIALRGLPGADDPHCGCRHRLDFEPPALRHHRPRGGGPMKSSPMDLQPD